MTAGYRRAVSIDGTRRSTGASMLALVRARVEALVGEASPDATKRELLASLSCPSDAFEVGLAVRTWADNPVIRAVVSAPTAASVLERWQNIEAFGHASHRTKVVEADDDRLLLEHVCLVSTTIPAAEDHFVWGLVVGLLELWGGEGISLEFPRGPVKTATVEVRFRAPPASPPTETGAGVSWAESVGAVLRSDLLRPWTLGLVATRLRRSSRSLQRYLRHEDTSFSAVLQRVRLDAAVELIEHTELGLSEIAFCTGFSDHAHLTRTARKLLDAPPSSLRTLLRTLS